MALPMQPIGASTPDEPRLDLDADSLIAHLDFPRFELRDLHRARDVIATTLRTAGLEPRVEEFVCRTHRADLAGAFFIAGALVFGWAARRTSRRLLAVAGSSAVLAIVTLGGGFDALLPAATQSNLLCVVESRLAPQREILFGAHYDTKTEPLDHVERAALFVAMFAAAILAGIRSWRPRRSGRVWCLVAAVAFLGGGAHLTTGRFLPPSHGILDNGVATILLIETAARYAVQPLSRTRLVFAWWAGEEHGAQGSAAAARAPAGDVPRAVINLECMGAGPDLGFAAYEWSGWRAYRADAGLHRTASRVARLRTLHVPMVTDAGSFLARGVPAITLVGMGRGHAMPRGLHGAADRMPALDRGGITVARRALAALVHGLDDEADHSALPVREP